MKTQLHAVLPPSDPLPSLTTRHTCTRDQATYRTLRFVREGQRFERVPTNGRQPHEFWDVHSAGRRVSEPIGLETRTATSMAAAARAAASTMASVWAESGAPLGSCCPSELGIDMDRADWFVQAVEWAVAYRAAARANAALRVWLATTDDDFAHVERFVKDLAEYERAPGEVVTSAGILRRDADRSAPQIAVVLCARAEDAEPCAFAMYHPIYSSWKGRCLYVEDLFVDPPARRLGVGTELIRVGATAAVITRCARLSWMALTWNEPALRCYAKLEATPLDEWVTLRLHGDALAGCAMLPDRESHDSEV